ncbi:hypothetical protein [Thalassomonas actiniarum]|uniref:Uncharacterized protein n=1 Tax=Thalassomonas actiniarum TaxID=485447 RepID=A0AAF0C4E4_9GAMM|nr:hypothetical protein [Thalassomonas actiniarum]WDD99863.1 hypothetical protein SG35_004125 [Thalassomonas actiniarum]
MKNNKKLLNKTVELSLLKFVSAGTSGGVYIPPNKRSCGVITSHITIIMPPGE